MHRCMQCTSMRMPLNKLVVIQLYTFMVCCLAFLPPPPGYHAPYPAVWGGGVGSCACLSSSCTPTKVAIQTSQASTLLAVAPAGHCEVVGVVPYASEQVQPPSKVREGSSPTGVAKSLRLQIR